MKKTILIDARQGSDFTLDAVWSGLVDRLGWENVIDWPPADKHREGIPTTTGDVERDYGAERRSLCYTPHHKSFPRYTRNQINQLIADEDVERIFVDEREESYLLYLQTIARYRPIPVVVVAGHDRFWNDSPLAMMRYYGTALEAMFLDNWRDEYSVLNKTYPMSYAINFDHLWDHENREKYLLDKIYDVCFMGYNSHGDRSVVVDHLLRKYGESGNCIFVERRPNTMESFLPKRDYFKKMAQSRICINLKGAAECGKALRFYEIPYVGSFMLSQDFPANQVNPFVHYEHCAYFGSLFDGGLGDLSDLDSWIDSLLKDETKRERIARQGHLHAMKYHTARARVDYIYEKLK